MIKISGNISKIIYYNDSNSYLIALFKIRSIINNLPDTYLNKIITIAGNAQKLNLEDDYKLSGNLVNHPRYGEQLDLQNYQVIAPTDEIGIITFLSSDLFPGIGLATAKKIVNQLGTETLIKIESDPSILASLNLSTKQQTTIINTLNHYHNSHNYIVKLTALGFKLNDAILIYNTFKKDIKNLFDDLYQIPLVTTIPFNKVHEIVSNNDLIFNELTFQKGYLLEQIKNLTINNGNTYTTETSLYNLSYRTLDEETIKKVLKLLNREKHIKVANNLIWLYQVYEDEQLIADFLSNPHSKKQLKELVFKTDILNHEQKSAVMNAFNHQFSIITGGPGTGKTMVIKHIVDTYKSLFPRAKLDDLVLIAPTGKASKRMMETTNYPASTIHRFLKWDMEQDTFAVNINEPANAKMIIIDEASMVDNSLMASLFRGVNSHTQIVFVGDYYQLPSIRSGQVLKDLIDSEVIPTTYLKQIYRQAKGSLISELATAIINADESTIMDVADGITVKYEGLENNQIRPFLMNEYLALIKEYSIDNIVILAPKYAGENGIDRINQNITELLTKNNKHLKYADTIFYENNKVLLINNLIDQNIFNGDTGYINSIDEDKSLTINFNDNLHRFKYSELKHLKLGYALSIHKSQGSEYQVVILIITKDSYHMLNQQLIYTAITRAKEKLIIVGDIDLFIKASLNTNPQKRDTYLAHLLTNNVKQS